MRFTSRTRRGALLGLIATLLGLSGVPGAAATPSHEQINGTGSSWSANAVNQWIADVKSSGLQVVFTGGGSAPGRKDFANRTTDFAVSDIGYQGVDPRTSDVDSNCIPGQKCRSFAYEPIVAGGTAFPYQIKVAGKKITNLRLSGETLAKIFTYQINDWSDPAITADNNGRQLPSLPIIRVVHSEGSGSTAQFTSFLAKQYPDLWGSFYHDSNFTEYYPTPPTGKGLAQSQSDGVMNFVSSAAANGAIGYDEYSYPLAKGWPVAKILNNAGYYTLPDQYNVAVALRHAVINMDPKSQDYLLQKLDQVYTAPEPQVYPLSSYSYFLIPTGGTDDGRMTTGKRQTLADYLYYSVCQGQKEMGPIGYSPLPINLVEASFAQTAKLKAADPKVDLNQRNVETCNNPTFVKGHPEINHLAQIAPLPAACDKQGAGPCSANIGNTGNPGSAQGGAPGAVGSGTGSGAGTGGAAGTPAGGRGGSPGAASSTGTAPRPTTATRVDPETGLLVPVGQDAGQADIAGVPTELAAYRQQNMTGLLGPLAVIELLAVLALPPVVYFYLLRRRRGSS